MLVSHILERKGSTVHAIGPDASMLDAIKRMAEHHIGALLVMREDELLGIVTERDYARKIALRGRSSRETTVAQVMSTPPLTVSPEDTVEACMQLVTDQRYRHLPVVQDERVVGIVSIGDLVKAMLEKQQQTIEHLEAYIRS